MCARVYLPVCIHPCPSSCLWRSLTHLTSSDGCWQIQASGRQDHVSVKVSYLHRSHDIWELKVFPLGSVDAKILPPFICVCVWRGVGGGCGGGGGYDLLLLCLMVCAPLPFTQSSERRGSRWEESDVQLESPFQPPPRWRMLMNVGSDVINAISFYRCCLPWQPSLEKCRTTQLTSYHTGPLWLEGNPT